MKIVFFPFIIIMVEAVAVVGSQGLNLIGQATLREAVKKYTRLCRGHVPYQEGEVTPLPPVCYSNNMHVKIEKNSTFYFSPLYGLRGEGSDGRGLVT